MIFGNTSVVGWGFGVVPGGAAIRVGTGATNGNGATLTLLGAWTNGSDSTKKWDISTVKYGLAEVMKLRPVRYKWKITGQEDFGFLAQEVKNILPEIVYGEEGQMTISYGQITSVLTKAMQEQQKIIDNQRLAITKLETEFALQQFRQQEQQKSIENIKVELAEFKQLLQKKTTTEEAKKQFGNLHSGEKILPKGNISLIRQGTGGAGSKQLAIDNQKIVGKTNKIQS